jgi:hypothetical protein
VHENLHWVDGFYTVVWSEQVHGELTNLTGLFHLPFNTLQQW